MADEKLYAQVSHRLFATNRERMENNMNKINYQKILDKTIDEISASDKGSPLSFNVEKIVKAVS